MKFKLLIAIVMVSLLAQIVVTESQQSYSVDQNEPRELRSSGGGRGGGGGRSSSSRSSYSSYRSSSYNYYHSGGYSAGYYNPISGTYNTVGYSRSSIGFYYGAYNNYYTYAYYGPGASQTTCFAQDAECLLDLQIRTQTTWTMIGCLIAFFGIMLTVLILYLCRKSWCALQCKRYNDKNAEDILGFKQMAAEHHDYNTVGIYQQVVIVHDEQNLQNQPIEPQQQQPYGNPYLDAKQAQEVTQYQQQSITQNSGLNLEMGGFSQANEGQSNNMNGFGQQPVSKCDVQV